MQEWFNWRSWKDRVSKGTLGSNPTPSASQFHMEKENISIINIRDIKNKRLAKIIPEFYELRDVIENNPWHNQEPVFNHTLSVLDNLEKVIHNSSKDIKRALTEVVDKNSRNDLLYVAALFHDIGKKETITDLGNGVRGCPGHERKGTGKAEKILKRFDLSKREFKIITGIVRNHGVIHDIIGLGCKDFRKSVGKERSLTHVVTGLENKNFQTEYKSFKKEFSNISYYLELILLAFADTVGSYLEKTKPAEFRHRVNFYKKELKSLSSKKK